MSKSKEEKTRQLGMNPSTASGRLHRDLLYEFSKRLDMHWCYQCGAEIENVQEMSVEHKIPWMYSEDPTSLFFDLDNIAFSHKSCNYRAARKSRCNITGQYRKPSIQR
jgi:hypothetical protein